MRFLKRSFLFCLSLMLPLFSACRSTGTESAAESGTETEKAEKVKKTPKKNSITLIGKEQCSWTPFQFTLQYLPEGGTDKYTLFRLFDERIPVYGLAMSPLVLEQNAGTVIALSLPGGRVEQNYFLQTGALTAFAKENYGLAISGLLNSSEENYGLQAALINHNGKFLAIKRQPWTYGVQIGGYNDEGAIQLGVINSTGKIQLGAVNGAGVVQLGAWNVQGRGLQIGGVNWSSGKLFQFGAVNRADGGFQIGLLNYNERGALLKLFPVINFSPVRW